MASSDGKAYARIKLGRGMTDILPINISQAMIDVHFYIGSYFKSSLPKNYHIEFYNEERKMFTVLDANVLKTDMTPFKVDSKTTSEGTICINDCILLFIVEDPPVESRMGSQLNIAGNLSTDNDFTRALPHMENSDVFDAMLFDSGTTLNTLNGGEIRQNNVPFDPEHNSNHQYPNMMEPSLGKTKATFFEHQNIDFNRLRFAPDANPIQKHQYLSNQFPVGTNQNNKSGISLVQGVKTADQRKKQVQVLPGILAPPSCRRNKELHLRLYATYEEKDGQFRVWYKNPHQGFLPPDQLQRSATLSNPFSLKVNEKEWTSDGHYLLKMYLITKRSKDRENKEEIYRLSETETLKIHSAEHIPRSKKPIPPTRIICVPVIDNIPQWPLAAISNFIIPPESKKDAVAANNSSAEAVDTVNLHLDGTSPSTNLTSITTSIRADFQLNRIQFPAKKQKTH